MEARRFVVGVIVTTASYEFFQCLAGPTINSFFGVFIIGLTIMLCALIGIFINWLNGANSFVFAGLGFFWAFCVGVSAFGIDLFSLFAFKKEIQLSTFAPLIAGGVIIILSIVGFLKGDYFSADKIVGTLLILIGCILVWRA